MAHVIVPPSWQIPEREATDKQAFSNRRQFLKSAGIAAAATILAPGCAKATPGGQDVATAPDGSVFGPLDTVPANAPREGYPAARNASFKVPERPVTERIAAASYNNFYEFISSGDLKNVWPLVNDYKPFPSTIKVSGLVEKPFEVDVADLMREMTLEERLYRFRCVEAWSMTVPWTGFPLRKLIEKCKPLSKATHVAFVSANKPKEMPGIKNAPWYDWPYFEGLRIAEATNDLAFVATGSYGEPLTKQQGSPLRLALPWKYGYKGPKAIVELKFVDKQPPTFWNKLQPAEYGFLSNVNPNVPHPRWSQASERFILNEDDLDRRDTMLFNGYADLVGSLYPDEPTRLTRVIR
jgi:sulfoxide reductase catalytic subunit YedY